MAEHGKLVAPYLEWAVLSQFAYLRGDWFWVLLELNEPTASFSSRVDGANVNDLIHVPSIYQTPSREFRKSDLTFCMARMCRRALASLVNKKETKGLAAKRLEPVMSAVKRIELGTPTASLFGASPVEALEPLSANSPPAAIVAVIDDGLAFAHERFRFASGDTRFKYFWNQDDMSTTKTPAGFGWGRELSENELNTLLASCNHSGLVDEDALYQQAGQNLASRRAKHGTHVMDIACGLDPKSATAQSPYLIGVQLPKWATEETSGAWLTPLVYAAISYILDRADRIAAAQNAAPLPVVVNLSYGTIAGPHDGTGMLELAIDQLIAARPAPLQVVLPAGNHYLARCHAHFEMPRAAPRKAPIEILRWRVQPDNKACSFLEIWLPQFASDHTRPKVELRITTPTGQTSPWISPNKAWSWPAPAPAIRFYARYYDIAGRRPTIHLSMAPTAEMKANPRTAPSGTWLVEIKNRRGAVAVDAWVQRGDTPFGYPLWGRQSRLDDSTYVRFDLAGRPEQNDVGPSSIRRRGTVNALATGQRAIVVGGYRRDDRKPSEYAAAGPVATPAAVPPPRTGPDAAAAADDSVTLHGLLAAGTRTGSVVAMRGTSVAAPQVTRRISELMTLALASDRAAVQAGAAAADLKAPTPGSTLHERLGAGRIELPPRNTKRWKRW
jgi:hypothetical protein